MRIYAVGDIHGHLDKLKAAHARIEKDRARFRDVRSRVVHLGDYVDRGPDSAGVLSYLSQGLAEGKPWVLLLGNHDLAFQDYLESDGSRGWLSSSMGGLDTLASYGVKKGFLTSKSALKEDARSKVPPDHLELLRHLAPYHETRDLVFVHAGIRPGIPLDQQEEKDLVWIRGEFLTFTGDHGRIVVHGHTPVERPEHHGNRIALDTGAAYGGDLTAAVFEGPRCWILTENGRERLEPL